MPILSNAHNTTIIGGNITEIHEVNSYHTGVNLSIHNPANVDPILQILYQATATGAAYNSQERYPPPKCHPGTRKVVLEQIEAWVDQGSVETGGSMMWLHGPAGAGKSAIAQTICETCADRGQLAASFFFIRGHPNRGGIERFFTTLSLQLSLSLRHLRSLIAQTVHDNPLIAHASAAEQMEKLIVKPLQGAQPKIPNPQSPFLIVVDGLDECTHNRNQTLVINHLHSLIRTHKLPLSILLVSRPEPHIKYFFDETPDCEVLSLLGDQEALEDVGSFLREGFEAIYNSEHHAHIMKYVPKPWPTDAVLHKIVQKSGGYFIYASTILSFVDEEYYSPVERLNDVIDISPTSPTTAFGELDKLYLQILSTCPRPALLQPILACIVLQVVQLTSSAIELSLELRTGDVMLNIRGLHSLLNFDNSSGHREAYISPVHASLEDFLLNKDRAGDFFIDPEVYHRGMVIRSLDRISNWSQNMSPNGLRFTEEPHLRQAVMVTHIADDLRLHFVQLSSIATVLDNLETVNADSWAEVVRGSRDWPVDVILKMTVVITYLEGRVHSEPPSYQYLNSQMDNLLDSFYLTYFDAISENDVKFIQAMSTIFNWSNEITPEALLKFMQLRNTPQVQRYLKFYNTLVLDTHETVHEIGYARSAFATFIQDPSRCGDIFADATTRHSDLAVYCARALIELPTCTTQAFLIFQYATTNHRRHLRASGMIGLEKVIQYLRDLDLETTFSGLLKCAADHTYPESWPSYYPHLSPMYTILYNIGTLLASIECLADPPVDILLPWREFYLRLYSADAAPEP